jgi:hypothetical protein
MWRDLFQQLRTGEAEYEVRSEPRFWQLVRVLVWLRRKAFCRPLCTCLPLIEFLEQEVHTDNAIVKTVQLLRARPDDSLLRRLPTDVFNYVLLPMLRWPPYEGHLIIPGLTSAEVSNIVHATFV